MYEILENENEEELDTSWINEFNKIDKLYQVYYLDDIYEIQIHFVYIDTLSNISNIKKEKFILNTINYISREEIIGILKKNMMNNNIKYTLLSILKYNINIDPTDIKKLLQSPHAITRNSFLTPIKNIDVIHFNRTINMFQDLNDLFIIFFEKNTTENYCKTKRIYIKHNNLNKKTKRK
jgi:hypothetical protein